MPSSSISSDSSDDERNSRAGLKAWWSNFTRAAKSPKKSGPYLPPSIGTSTSTPVVGKGKSSDGNANRVFGVPLRTSLKYASVAISMAGPDGKQYVWGYIPAVVAKLGLFLKENAIEVEGVFRIAGSQKRMKELQELFEKPPKYGKNVDWSRTTYSVHDAASVLRRYFNHMPEPIVPLHLYSEFRNVIIKKPFDPESAIKTYRLLIQSSPPANQYLLLYVLDLLAVFARKSDKNLMTAANLAVIFQPGMFSHPSHLTSAEEHQMAVQVLEFLIEHQDQFVLGLSPPPPPHVRPEDLTAVSRPEMIAAADVEPDALVASDSDEDLGELEVHEGGGAALARKAAEANEAAHAAKVKAKEEKAGKGLFNAINKLAHTTLLPTPTKKPEAEDIARVNSVGSSTSHLVHGGAFFEGRDVGGPADSVVPGKSPSPQPQQGASLSRSGSTTSPPTSPRLGSSKSPGVRRSKTTPTKKPGTPQSDGTPGSPRPRRRRKDEAGQAAAASPALAPIETEADDASQSTSPAHPPNQDEALSSAAKEAEAYTSKDGTAVAAPAAAAPAPTSTEAQTDSAPSHVAVTTSTSSIPLAEESKEPVQLLDSEQTTANGEAPLSSS